MTDNKQQETTIIIKQLQAMTVIRLQEARPSSDSRQQCHHTAARSNVIRQQEGISSPDSRKTGTVKMLAVTGLQLTHIHKQITSHKSDFPFNESALRQGKMRLFINSALNK
jgi:hypothetical protein